MNQDDIIRMAREAGIVVTGEAVWKLCEIVAAAERQRMEIDSIHTCHAECPRPACVAVRDAVALAVEPLQSRITDLYRQLDEAEKQLDQQYKMGMEYKLDECILILERLHERSGGQYNYYLHAAKVLKGEV